MMTFFLAAVAALLLLGLLTLTAAVTDRFRILFLQAAMDAAQIYQAFGQARLDIETRRQDLTYARNIGRMKLLAQRQLLQQGRLPTDD